MADMGDLVLEQWKLAMRQANGDGEVVVEILATALGLGLVEAGVPIENALALLRDQHEGFVAAHAEAIRKSSR